jgi:hypothetical protein
LDPSRHPPGNVKPGQEVEGIHPRTKAGSNQEIIGQDFTTGMVMSNKNGF